MYFSYLNYCNISYKLQSSLYNTEKNFRNLFCIETIYCFYEFIFLSIEVKVFS